MIIGIGINIPLFCETRSTAKYKSIRIFSENFLTIVRVLEKKCCTSHRTRKRKPKHISQFSSYLIIPISAPHPNPSLVSKYQNVIYIAINLSQKISDPNMKFYNNTFNRFFVNCDQLFAEITKTYIHTYRNFFEGVFIRLLIISQKYRITP